MLRAHLTAALAGHFKVTPENIVLGAGSQEILKNAVRAFTSRDRGLVTASPTFENPTTTVKKLEHPLKEIPVDSSLKLDIDGMLAARHFPGLVQAGDCAAVIAVHAAPPVPRELS